MLRIICMTGITILALGCKSPLSQFAWLEGEWTMERPKGGARLETWEVTNKNLLTGKGLKVIGRDTTLLESIQLLASDGGIFYTPTVPDQNEGKPVPFRMTSIAGQVVVFENPAHDFPQRIVYRFVPGIADPADADSLYVTVSSMDGEGIDYAFRRK